MSKVGRFEVNGRQFELVAQSPDQARRTSACAGCVAEGKADLCNSLPSSCMKGRIIWVARK